MNGTALFFFSVFAYVGGCSVGLTTLILRWADSEQFKKDKEAAARFWGKLLSWSIAKVSQATRRAYGDRPTQ